MRKIVSLGFLLAALAGWAETPSVLNEAAMWLDASDPQYFTFAADGGVESWINRSATGRAVYGDAKASKVDTRTPVNKGGGIRRGALTTFLDAPVYDMFGTGSDVDLTFTRISTIRTVFIVGTFVNDDSLSPLLGDSTYYDFHRGKSGYLWNTTWATQNNYTGSMTFYLNSATATCAADTTAPVANARNIIAIECSVNAHASSIGRDRTYQQTRNGGRQLNEVLIFTRALTAAERTAVYNYLDAKWNSDGWKGAFNQVAAPWTFTDDTTVETGKAALVDPSGRISVASGKTATVNDFTTGKSVNFFGGGTLDLVGGASFSGWMTQTNGTVNLGGGGISLEGNPVLNGAVTWKNGTIRADYVGDLRPAANTTLTLGDGAKLIKNRYWRTFIDKGNVTLNLESGSLMDVGAPFIVSIDSGTKNYLNINGGTLVVTNKTDSYVQHCSVTIGSQQNAGCVGYMTMNSGRLVTDALRCAAGYAGDSAALTATGYITVNGGTIELSNWLLLGTSHATRGSATVVLNGGEITAVNGVRMLADDIDTLTLNGVTFHVKADKTGYFSLAKASGANTSLGANGFTMDVASGKKASLGWGFKGTGAITKRGAGTLTLDKAATFTGGLTVSEGTAILSTATSAGTGTIQLATGATLDVQALTLPLANSFTADGGTLLLTARKSGKQIVMPTTLTELPANLTTTVKDEQGTVLPTASLSVADGNLYVTVPDTWTADVTDGTSADWYALAWQQGGVAQAFPTTAGAVVDAVVTAAGTSTVTLGADVHASKVAYTSTADATTTLTGTGKLDAALDLTGFTGDFRLDGVNVAGTVAYGAKTNLVLWADAGESWTNNLGLTGTGVIRKGGAGTVVWPWFPPSKVNVTDGILAFIEASDVSRSPSNLTGSGTKEKRGAGTLTLTGGSFPGAWRITEGTLKVSCDFKSAGTSIYVGKGAKYLVPHCSQVNNRLPLGAQVVVDGGTFEVGGVNPFNTDSTANSPDFFVTNGTFSVLNTTGAEHIKFESLTLKDSSFIIKGTSAAYSKNAIYMQPSPCKITSDGAVSMTFESASCPNSLAAAADITLAVNSGTNLFAVSVLTTIYKTGAGMIRFPTTAVPNSTAFVYVKEGKVGGGQIKRLGLYGGVSIVPDETNPLTVTESFSLPGSSVSASNPVLIDASGIDFTDRTKEVVVMKREGQTMGDAAKFSCPNLPADWKICVSDGIYLRKVSSAQNLTWTTGNGTWTATDWNNGTAYADGYHSVAFADSENAATTVTLDNRRFVKSADFSATNTFYALTGANGLLWVNGAFAPTGKGGFAIEVPLLLETGGLTFEATTADQTIADIRMFKDVTTVGVVNVPAAAGGTALLTHTDSSPRAVAGIAIGSGKTFEWRNNSTSANGASLYSSAAITGDATTKLRISAPRAGLHTDSKTDSPNFKGRLEVTDQGFFHINSKFVNMIATEAQPVEVHGTNSVLSVYDDRNTCKEAENRIACNSWYHIWDGGQFYIRGINVTYPQDKGPCLVVSNAQIKCETIKGSHLHFGHMRFSGDSSFYLAGTPAAYHNEGAMFHQNPTVGSGTTRFYCDANCPNMIVDSDTTGLTFTVAEGGLLSIGTTFREPLHKAGAGAIQMEERGALGSGTLYLEGGDLVANKLANNLLVVTASNGAGFDLSAEDSCFAPTNGVALTAESTSRLKLKTGTRELELDEYLVKWTAGHAPGCSFQLVADDVRQYRWSVVRVADGVKVGRRSFVILLR